MPELPEVEFAARSLRRWLRGTDVVAVHVRDARVLHKKVPARTFARALVGHRVAGVDRRGKWLRVRLDGGTRLFSHLGMTGKWVHRSLDQPQVRFERVRLEVTTNARAAAVVYVDPRVFGRLVVATADIPEWSSLGPDPLIDEIDIDVLASGLARQRRSVKAAIMDQAVIAGVGNIYATESLWRARIDPRTPAHRLSRRRLAALVRAIDATLRAALADAWGPVRGRGRREITYVEEAGAPNPFRIYGRAGEPCPRCRRPLDRTVLGGRTTVFCASCQSAAS